MKKKIIVMLITLLSFCTLYAQSNIEFLKADSLFCHDSQNYLSSFHDGAFLFQFEKSRIRRITSYDSAIVINSEVISIKSPSGEYLTFWLKGKNFFIRSGDTTYSINNAKIIKRYYNNRKNETVIQLMNGGFTLIPMDGVIIHVSRSVGLVDKIFFESDNRTIMFEFLSLRGLGHIKRLSIHHKQGRISVLFYSKTLKPYIINSFSKEGINWFSLAFRERYSVISDAIEGVKVTREENSRAPDYEYKIYYTYNKKGILYPDFSIKVNICN